MNTANINVRYGLPFINTIICYGENKLELKNVLVDTGSAGTIFSVDRLSEIGIIPEPNDPIKHVRGVGGTEYVFTKTIDGIIVAGIKVNKTSIQSGAMDYGFEIDGILGMDLLAKLHAIIDFHRLVIKVR